MSLAHCPECGHEVSLSAVACPNCGRPTTPPVVAKRVVVAPPPRRETGFQPWMFAPIGIVAILLLFFAYMMMREGDDQANVNVNINAAGRRTTQVPASDTTTVTAPPSSDTQTVTVPAPPPIQPSVPSTSTSVPGTTTEIPTAPPSDRGTVTINARVTQARGTPRPVLRARFYLLADDIETILSKADIEPIEGNSLTASLGLATVFPDRYGEFSRAAMRAIANASKYSGTTDAAGKAGLKDVAPDQYYLFGITKVGRGFAMWNSPVSVVTGENIMNLSPQSVTEIPEG